MGLENQELQIMDNKQELIGMTRTVTANHEKLKERIVNNRGPIIQLPPLKREESSREK